MICVHVHVYRHICILLNYYCIFVHDCTGKKKNRIAIQSIQRYAKLPPLPIIPILSKSDFMLQHAATKVLRWYQLYQLYQLFKSQAFLPAGTSSSNLKRFYATLMGCWQVALGNKNKTQSNVPSHLGSRKSAYTSVMPCVQKPGEVILTEWCNGAMVQWQSLEICQVAWEPSASEPCLSGSFLQCTGCEWTAPP